MTKSFLDIKNEMKKNAEEMYELSNHRFRSITQKAFKCPVEHKDKNGVLVQGEQFFIILDTDAASLYSFFALEVTDTDKKYGTAGTFPPKYFIPLPQTQGSDVRANAAIIKLCQKAGVTLPNQPKQYYAMTVLESYVKDGETKFVKKLMLLDNKSVASYVDLFQIILKETGSLRGTRIKAYRGNEQMSSKNGTPKVFEHKNAAGERVRSDFQKLNKATLERLVGAEFLAKRDLAPLDYKKLLGPATATEVARFFGLKEGTEAVGSFDSDDTVDLDDLITPVDLLDDVEVDSAIVADESYDLPEETKAKFEKAKAAKGKKAPAAPEPLVTDADEADDEDDDLSDW